jgi:hypothetical protein
MAFPRESVEQHRGVIPRWVRVVARVLWCRSIKCPYTWAGAGTTCVQVPSSEAVLAEGALSPRARRKPCSWERLTLERGEPRPRKHPPCHPLGLWAPPGSWSCRVCALGSWVSLCFAFFAGFKRVSPGYFRGPSWLSPRHGKFYLERKIWVQNAFLTIRPGEQYLVPLSWCWWVSDSSLSGYRTFKSWSRF